MIDHETQLKIQAFLDGELAGTEAREIAALIAKDRDAAALHTELKNTRRVLATEQGMQHPESRELFWSKIQRDIERLEPAKPVVEPGPTLWQLLNRLLKPVAAVAAVVVLGTIVFNANMPNGSSDSLVASADMDAITFRDDSNGTTYVWFADSGGDAMQNDVANDQDDTTLE